MFVVGLFFNMAHNVNIHNGIYLAFKILQGGSHVQAIKTGRESLWIVIVLGYFNILENWQNAGLKVFEVFPRIYLLFGFHCKIIDRLFNFIIYSLKCNVIYT